ncbi:alpha/beta fold hydrolase [Psychroflexus sp. MES1-P1E]|uniref:alpha/beta fold hydrolase n=1 Tax=Psychroflexus sp. MES1-P1E TaxID=2058320 RepID=UPI000C7C8785|nr:alpha/beta hydrolase [Psychroflexus sp. MES1-P1E]PKG41558.1 hydrolase [Psychroflexus sp. MES1-P1E]
MDKEVVAWKKKGRKIDVNGHQVFYIKEGSGPNLLILHGYPFNSFEWKFVWKNLVKGYTVFTFDYLGMGFSDKPKDHDYSFHEHCEMVNFLIEFWGIKQTHILSHDLGVSIVQELLARDLASQNCFKIKSVAFMNGGLFMDSYKPRIIQRLLSQSPKPIGKLLSKLLTKKKLKKSIQSVFGPYTLPTEKLINQFWDILNYNDGKSIAYLIGRLVFDKLNHQERWISAMQNTKIPMCFINGPFDPNSGIHMANRYKELIPNPNVKLLWQDIGHWPQIEDPGGVLLYYQEFRDEINNTLNGNSLD